MKTSFPFLFFIIVYWLGLNAVQGIHRHGGPVKFHSSPRMKRSAVVCDPNAIYRRVDGQCNNLANPLWGSAPIPLDRVVPHAYEGGSGPRVTSVSGGALPSAREISLKCHPRNDTTDSKVTLMVMHWGQFIDHDISLTPKGDENLCPCDSPSSECFGIPLSNDEYFAPRECLEFKRSNWMDATDSIHSTPIRQQINAITAFIDGSSVYGSSDEQLAALRNGDGHELKVFAINGQEFMPPNSNAKPCRPARGMMCFLAGDGRANVQPALTALHTLFVREHNRIANLLKSSTDMSDDVIFEETRKIIGAMLQHINYKEFLPMVIGPTYSNRYDLGVNSFAYDPNLKPDVTNVFATAAFRFGHSQVTENLDLSCRRSLEFKNLWLEPSHTISSFDLLLSEGANQLSTVSDRFFSHSVTRHLFQKAEKLGSDLPALNIQRARDHGLPSYNTYRQWCGFNRMTSLSDLFPDDAEARAVYESIDDVDVFTGGMAESPLADGLVGKTFACILGEQFRRLKSGDRFFYLTRERPVRFSGAQLSELKRVRLSKLICDNTDIVEIQKNVFLPVDPVTNPLRRCDDLSSFSINAWIPDRR